MTDEQFREMYQSLLTSAKDDNDTEHVEEIKKELAEFDARVRARDEKDYTYFISQSYDEYQKVKALVETVGNLCDTMCSTHPMSPEWFKMRGIELGMQCVIGMIVHDYKHHYDQVIDEMANIKPVSPEQAVALICNCVQCQSKRR